jgi:IclR family transcriptional regulator, acetate operon repressor
MLLQTLDRGLALLEWVTTHPETATVRGAASALDININSCYHLVNTLVSRRYLAKTDGGKLALGPAVFELWSWFLRHEAAEDLLIPAMKELRERAEETVHLVIWDGSDVSVIASAEGPQVLTVSTHIGHPDIPHLLSGGKAILAYLEPQQLDEYIRTHELVSAHQGEPPVREEELRAKLAEVATTGFAADVDEVFPGVGSIAAPFFGSDGRVVGALTVSSPSSRHRLQRSRQEREVFAAAEKSSRRLGYRGPYPVLRP